MHCSVADVFVMLSLSKPLSLFVSGRNFRLLKQKDLSDAHRKNAF